ncbi:MAG TPA: hypothetical protein VIE65_12380 [Methylobacter sp.]|jgi:hypothetical protein
MNWTTDKDGEEINVENDETHYLMVGCYTSLNSTARAIAEFSNNFKPDEDEMEGPLEGFNVSVTELDGKIGDGFHLTDIGVCDDELKIYEELDVAQFEYLERLRNAKKISRA